MRDRKLADPVAPKRLLEAPPPNPEPMSAPLPCWSRTRPMIANATSTCIPITTFSQVSIRSIPLLRCDRDRDEIGRHQRRAAYQSAVDVRHGEQARRVVLLYAAAVQDARIDGELLSQERVHFLRLPRARGASRPDRPDRLLSHNRVSELLFLYQIKNRLELSRDHFLRTARLAL